MIRRAGKYGLIVLAVAAIVSGAGSIAVSQEQS
jgi:hypothetical protein